MKNILDIRSYLVFLSRNKMYAVITTIGFALALAFVILMTLYTRDQFSVDKHQTKADRTFLMYYNNNELAYVPPALGDDLEGRYAEIESYCRFGKLATLVKSETGEKVNANGIVVDSSFFTMFTLTFVDGNAQSALPTDDFVVLSESFARKIFGDRSAVGQTIQLPEMDNKVLTVGAVIKNIKNSTIPDCDIIARLGVRKGMWLGYTQGYNACNYHLFVLLAKGVDLNAKADDIAKFLHDDIKFWGFTNDYFKSVHFVPLQEVYFGLNEDFIFRRGNLQFVMILLAAALIILIFAVINYINLSVAQSGFRAKEMATRRLLGASVAEISSRFIFESIFVCTISFLLGILFATLAEPVFNDIMQTNLNIQAEFTLLNIAASIGFVLLLGTVSGVVPAYVITKFKPVDVVKGAFSYRTKRVYSKVLITFQYLITIVLIGATIVIGQQTAFMRNIELGFRTKDLYVVQCAVPHKAVQGLRSRLLATAGVEAVSALRFMPIYWGTNHSFTYNNIEQSFTVYTGDSLWMDMMGIEILERTGNTSDTASWINQTGLRNLGLEKIVDKVVTSEGDTYTFKGVVKDFHFGNLDSPISSSIVSEDGTFASYILLELSTPEAIERIKAIFSDFTQGNPFEGEWVESRVEQWSDKVRRQGELIGYLALIAIIISSLGMLAMATFFINQQAVSIAVRKVFGASKGEVLQQLMWRFLKMVLVGYILAVPVIWYGCSMWLEDFAYRIEISVFVYLAAGVIAFAVAWLTIFWQAYKAMLARPALTLKKG